MRKRKINDLDSHLMKEWNDLRKLMWNKNVIISPNRFKKTIEYVSEKRTGIPLLDLNRMMRMSLFSY